MRAASVFSHRRSAALAAQPQRSAQFFEALLFVSAVYLPESFFRAAKAAHPNSSAVAVLAANPKLAYAAIVPSGAAAVFDLASMLLEAH